MSADQPLPEPPGPPSGAARGDAQAGAPWADRPRAERPQAEARRGSGDGPPGTEEAVGHLQAAGRELIAAARAVLDLLEDVVEDPDAISSAANAVGSLARSAMAGDLPTAPGRNRYGSGDAEGGHDDPGDGVHHIRIS